MRKYLCVECRFGEDGIGYFERILTQEILDEYKECIKNGANPKLETIPFYKWVLELRSLDVSKIENFNGSHFIYGWWENFAQSDIGRSLMEDDSKVVLNVRYED